MSIAEVTARISEIQQQLKLYVDVPKSSGVASSTLSGTGFAATLDSALDSALGSALGRSTSDATTAATSSQEAVIDEAERYLGVPYVWGGTDPDTGLDCSGFVQLVYGNLGYDLPRVSRDQAQAGREVTIDGAGGLENAQPGDLLAFHSPVDHIAIYVGDGKMIEAPHAGADVRITDVWDTPVAIRRVLPEQTDTAAQLAAAQRSFLSAYGSSLTTGSSATSYLTPALGTL